VAAHAICGLVEGDLFPRSARREYMAMPLDAGAGADMGGAREFGGLDLSGSFK